MPKSRKLRPSSTPGRMKGTNCQKSENKNLFVHDTKLHKTNPKLWLSILKEVQSVQNAKGNAHKLHELIENY